MKYKQILLSSIKTPIKQPLLFFPSIALFLTNTILILLFLSVTGLLPLLTQNPAIIFEQDLQTIINYLQLNFESNLLNILITFIGFVVINFLVGSGLLAMKFGLIKEVAKKRKITLRKAVQSGKKYTFRIIKLKVFVFVCMALLILILNSIFPRLLSISNSIIFVTLTYFMIKVSYQIINFILLFRYPILLTKNKGVFFTIKETFRFFKSKTKFVIATWIIIFIITTITTLFLLFLNTSLTATLTYGLVIFLIIKSLTDIIISLWQDIFLFFVYFFKEK